MRRGPTVSRPAAAPQAVLGGHRAGRPAGRHQLSQVERVASTGLPEGLAEIAVQLAVEKLAGELDGVVPAEGLEVDPLQTNPSFQRARIPSGSAVPARTVTMAAALPAETSWNTRVADASSRRWASSTTSNRSCPRPGR